MLAHVVVSQSRPDLWMPPPRRRVAEAQGLFSRLMDIA
jgi:hypothetical protein